MNLLKILSITICFSTSAKYRVLVSDFLITERGTVVPTAKELSDLYRPKFFPREYRIYFESENAYQDFLTYSSVVKEKRGIGCHEYIIYKGEVVLHRVFRRFKKCNDGKDVENFSCTQLHRLNEVNGDLQIKYEQNLVSNCLASLIFVGQTINNQTNQYRCHNEPLDLNALPYPDTKDNSGKRKFFFVTNSFKIVSIAKELFDNDYYSKEGAFFFETKKAYEKFKKNSTQEYILEKGFIRYCYKITKFSSHEIREPVKKSSCY